MYRPGNKASHIPIGRVRVFLLENRFPTARSRQAHGTDTRCRNRAFQAGRCPGNPGVSPRSHRGNPGPEGHRYPVSLLHLHRGNKCCSGGALAWLCWPKTHQDFEAETFKNLVSRIRRNTSEPNQSSATRLDFCINARFAEH